LELYQSSKVALETLQENVTKFKNQHQTSFLDDSSCMGSVACIEARNLIDKMTSGANLTTVRLDLLKVASKEE